MPDASSPSLAFLITGGLVAVFGPIAIKVLERLMGGASTWVWRLLAFCCIAAGWIIVLLNEPIKSPALLHPRAYGLVTVGVVAVAALIVRSSWFDLSNTAKLKARLMCLRVDTEVEKEENRVNCWFTMSIHLRNDGYTDTSVTSFQFIAKWEGIEYESMRIRNLDRYHLKSFRPGDIGSSSKYVDEYEQLFDFQTPFEITTTNSAPGWLRFFIRGLPLSENSGSLRETMEITLLAIDKKGDPHTAYKGNLPDGECGPIELIGDSKTSSQPEPQRLSLEVAYDKGRYDHKEMEGERMVLRVIRLRIKNNSSKDITGIKAKVESFDSVGAVLRHVPLRISHDVELKKQDGFKLTPGEEECVDVVEREINSKIIRLCDPLARVVVARENSFKSRVIITAEGEPRQEKHLRITASDDGQLLHCVALVK